jgi:alpha-L-fucosidase
VGFYYSHWQDWEHPGGGRPKEENPAEPTLLRRQPSQEAFERYWTEKCLPQVAELIEGYRPDLFWFDNWRAAEHLTPERLDRLIALVRERSPDCLINSRIGTTWNHPRGDESVDYLSMHDNHFPTETIGRPWETSGTMNRSWGYHQLDFAWKSSGQFIRHLVDNASRGGNYQLNVGPLADGRLPLPAVRRLREIGAWLSVNGEAIYGTQPGLPAATEWGRITRRALADGRMRLYLHVYDWRGGQDLPALQIESAGAECRVLETGQEVAVRRTEGGLVVTLPVEQADERVTVLMLDLTPGGSRPDNSGPDLTPGGSRPDNSGPDLTPGRSRPDNSGPDMTPGSPADTSCIQP